MKLYTNNQGQWVGTQDEARRQFGKDFAMVEVPTSKEALMKWLNKCMVVSQAHQQAAVASGAQTVPTSTLMKPHAWQTIKECAEKAPLKDLGVALAVAMNRLAEGAE
jgi:hypothetical protein